MFIKKKAKTPSCLNVFLLQCNITLFPALNLVFFLYLLIGFSSCWLLCSQISFSWGVMMLDVSDLAYDVCIQISCQALKQH